jgi:exosortase/archaeosortase family protein
MIRTNGEGWARLTLLVSLAASQLTLLVRADFAAFAIMAILSWLAGALLLLEREEKGSSLPLSSLSGGSLLAGLLLLLWSLLVLCRVGRLYDPLLHLLPLAALAGLALLSGIPWRSASLGTLLVVGSLLPAQVLINRFLPDGPIATVTARLSSVLLWALGRQAYADGHLIVLPERTLIVGSSCTGINTMALSLAAAVVLVILLPPPPSGPKHRRPSAWRAGFIFAAVALVLSFMVNIVRIVLLAYTDVTPGLTGLAEWRSFDFWHDGLGSNLFSLAAMSLVCAVWVAVQELALRQARFLERHP